MFDPIVIVSFERTLRNLTAFNIIESGGAFVLESLPSPQESVHVMHVVRESRTSIGLSQITTESDSMERDL